MHSASFTAQDAATEITALINSRVSSPRHDELTAVIGKVMPAAPAIEPPGFHTPIDTFAVERAISEFEASCGDGDDTAWDKWGRVLDDLTRDTWKSAGRSLSALRAAAQSPSTGTRLGTSALTL